MIRAVLFDFGGTLYSYETLAPAEGRNILELARRAGIEAAPGEIVAAQRETGRQVFADYMSRPYYLHRDMFDAALRAMLSALGAQPDQQLIDRYREIQWTSHSELFELRPGVIDTLDTLRERGIHIGMVSNIDEDQLRHLLDAAGVEPYFDAILSSERAGSCKPDGEIFRIALASAGCEPDEALFIGDSRPADVAGANAAGLQSVLLWHRSDRPPPSEAPQPRHVIGAIPELLELL